MYPLRLARYLIKNTLQHLILHVTNRCNFRCRHCFVDFGSPADLSVETCRRLAGEVGDLFWLDIGGGEPFLRHDLPDIVSSFKARVVMIPTNGSMVDAAVEQLREMQSRTSASIGVSLSLDGLKATHDSMRKPGGWDGLWSCYEKLRPIPNLSVKINTVLSRENSGEILELMDIVRKKKPDFHSVILLRGSPHDASVELPSIEELKKLGPEILRIQGSYDYGKGGLASLILRNYHRYMWRTSLQTLERKTQVVPCLAGKAHAVVYADGSVSSCEMLPTVGNVNNETWTQIMGSPDAMAQRASIRAMGCHCTHNCAMLDSIFFNPCCAARLLFPVNGEGVQA